MLAVLQDEGFSPQEAKAHQGKARYAAEAFREGWREARDKQAYTRSHYGAFSESIPALLASQESAGIVPECISWLSRRCCIGDTLKLLFRYMPLWARQMPAERITETLESLVASESNTPGYLGAYAGVLDSVLGKHAAPFHEIASRKGYLPLQLAGLAVSRLPGKGAAQARALLSLDDPLETDAIRAVRHVDHRIGCCPDTEGTYERVFREGGFNYGDCALISKGGEALALMKFTGEYRSMLALRTVRDTQGRHPLVFGALYGTNASFESHVRDAYKAQGKWARVEIEGLDVFPLRLMYTDGVPSRFAQGLDMLRDRAAHLKGMREMRP